jgi:hypothetical protein
VKEMAKQKTVKNGNDKVSKALDAVNELIIIERNEIKRLKQEAKKHENNLDEYITFMFKIDSVETTVEGLNTVKGLYQDYLNGKEFDKKTQNILRKAAIIANSVLSSDYKPPEEIKRIKRDEFEKFQAGFRRGIEYAKKIKK